MNWAVERLGAAAIVFPNQKGLRPGCDPILVVDRNGPAHLHAHWLARDPRRMGLPSCRRCDRWAQAPFPETIVRLGAR